MSVAILPQTSKLRLVWLPPTLLVLLLLPQISPRCINNTQSSLLHTLKQNVGHVLKGVWKLLLKIFFSLDTIDVAITTWLRSDGGTVSLRNVKPDMTRKQTLPLCRTERLQNLPTYTGPLDSPDLSLWAVEIAEERALFTVIETSGFDRRARNSTKMIRIATPPPGSPNVNVSRGYSTFIKVSTAPFAMSR